MANIVPKGLKNASLYTLEEWLSQVEGARFEIEYMVNPYREFESPLLRKLNAVKVVEDGV